jgi:hypothetical protein
MNIKQKICLWAGILVIVVMGVFPPWLVEGTRVEYWSIFAPPSQCVHNVEYLLDKIAGHQVQVRESGRRLSAEIITDYLFAQWFMAAAITGGLIITFQEKKQKSS